MLTQKPPEQKELRPTGLDAVDAVPWGAHFCLFYQSRQDLIDVLMPYFQAGLSNHECCLWICAEPLNAETARAALVQAYPEAEQALACGQIEFQDYSAWYANAKSFPADLVSKRIIEKVQQSLSLGFAGLRLSSNAAWGIKRDWGRFALFEAEVNDLLAAQPIITLCSYSLEKFTAIEVLEVVGSHQFAIVNKHGRLKLIQSSQQQKKDLALRESESRIRAQFAEFDQVYQNSAVGLCVLDRDLRYLRINEHLAEINGKSVAAHLGHSVREIVPEIAPYTEAAWRHILTTGEPLQNIEIQGWTSKQSAAIRHWTVNFSPLKSDSGEIIGLMEAVQEITDRKHAERARLESQERARSEEQLRILNKALEQRASLLRRLALQLTQAEHKERRRLAVILHDHLQQLLVGAKLGLGVVSKRTGNDAVLGAVKRATDLLDQALDISKSLTIELSPPILSESGLTAAIHWLGRWMQEKHGLAVVVESDGEIELDKEGLGILLFQSVRELLFNVVKHGQTKAAQVEISRTPENGIRIIVSDQGIGFDPERTVGTYSENGGFGLFSIRERLNILDGRVEIHSEPGTGTRIVLCAPFTHLNNPKPPATARQAGQGGGKQPLPLIITKRRIRILLVDDHMLLRQGLSAVLQEEPDLDVIGEASDGHMAVEMAKTLRPDVVMMDISMPIMNGIEATSHIKDELPHTKVIGLSMYEEEDQAAAIMEAGACAYLNKALPPEDLVNSIRRHCTAERTATPGP